MISKNINTIKHNIEKSKNDYVNSIAFIMKRLDLWDTPTSFENSPSWYQALKYVMDYLIRTVIPACKSNDIKINNLIDFYDEVCDYVENYFETLDVQEEINNKLDEMVDAGTLQEIINDYIKMKAIFCYDNVDDMKNATNLINGSYAKTLGFFNLNDNGGATYKIRTITNDDIIDNMTIIEMSNDNTLIAELIFNEQMNIKQLGATPETDSHDKIIKILSKNKTCIIPKGNWLTSPLKLNNGNVIKGENINYEVKTNDNETLDNLSILQCNQDCDTFIDCSNADHIILEICLSSCATKSDYLNAKNIQKFVKLDNTCYSTFDLFILCLNNIGLSIKSSWENTFKRLYFRGILKQNVTDIKCESSVSGISQNIFYDIQSEGFGATILDFSTGLFYHNKINSIMAELTPYSPFTETDTNATTQIPLLKIGNGSNNVIDDIQLNNFSINNGVIDNTIYEHSLFYVNSDSGAAFGLKVNNIVFDTGVNKPINFIKQEGEVGFLSSYLIIDSVINPTQQVIRTAMENMNYFKIGNIFQRFMDTIARVNPTESITKWFYPSNTQNVIMVSDSTNFNPFNNENAVIKIPETLTKISSIKVKTDDVLKIMYKSDEEVTYQIKFMARNNSTADTITGTLPARSSFGLVDLYTVIQTGLNIASISFSTPGNGFIADILC